MHSPANPSEPDRPSIPRRGPRYGKIRGAWHAGLGRVLYSAGKLERARQHFERSLALRGQNAVAYEYLCEIAFQLGDWTSWCRELEHLRRMAPDRHARLQRTQPFELLGPRTAGAMLAEPGNRATWHATEAPAAAPGPWQSVAEDPLRPSVGRSTAGRSGPRRSVRTIRTSRMSGSEAGGPTTNEGYAPPPPPIPDELLDEPSRRGDGAGHDDFSSPEERQEFADRPPISTDGMHPSDWAELLRRLHGEDGT